MAEAKYGRLFTEADVSRLLRELGVEPDLARRAVGSLTSTTFPPDEPLFLLRGQDEAATDVIGAYFHRSVGGDEHLRAVVEAGRAFADWQRENPDRVKVAD